MRLAIIGLAGLLLLAGCSKPSPGAAGKDARAASPAASAAASPPIEGTFYGNGKPGSLNFVGAYADDPFDGKPVTAVVLSSQDQAGHAKPVFDAVFGKLGDAIVAKIEPDGSLIGVDVVNSGLQSPSGSISLSGVVTLKDYHAEGGQISGRLTTGGDVDVFGQKLQIDVSFRTKAP
ncbi:hypothetical protein ACO2Q3_23705 [Caulobacter sp. KR2-114]|uniref:hypothetical protein n=1 Tax=Caulobacter sp. KR2-114 TaxID=3400912 RepID=UPI003BFF0B9C